MNDQLIDQYKDTFSGLGCFPAQYHIDVDKTFPPIQHGIDIITGDILVYCGDETYEKALADQDNNLKVLLLQARDVNLKFNKDKLQLSALRGTSYSF